MGGGPVLADIGVFIATNYPSTRTCQVGLVRFSTGAYSYVLIPTGVRIGNLFCYTVSKEIELIKRKTKTCRVVYHTVFRLLPWPNVVFNLARRDVKYQVSKKSQIAKAAGTSCSLVEKDYVKERVFIGVPTGKRFWISWYSTATVGRCSNSDHSREFFVKAGFFRNKSVRPTVRGVAMNPVDHPHGGRTKTNSPEVTPWGKIAKKGR